MVLALRHYDVTCRNAALLSGFMYGWSNTVKFSDPEDPSSIHTDFKDLNLTLKILEGASQAPESDQQALKDFRDLIRAALEKSYELKTIVLTV